MDIQQELTEVGREVVAGRLLVEQRIRFKGSKKAAYTAAGVNPATWERAISKKRVRPDKLVQIVTSLWPDSGGDWQSIPDPDQVRRSVFPGDLSALSSLSDWVQTAARDGLESPPPTAALILWDFEQLVDGLRTKYEADMTLRQFDSDLAVDEINHLRNELEKGGVEHDRSPATKTPAPDPADQSGQVDPAAVVERYLIEAKGDPATAVSTLTHDGPEGAGVDEFTFVAALRELNARGQYADAARDAGKSKLGKARADQDEQTTRPPDDPTGMEPL